MGRRQPRQAADTMPPVSAPEEEALAIATASQRPTTSPPRQPLTTWLAEGEKPPPRRLEYVVGPRPYGRLSPPAGAGIGQDAVAVPSGGVGAATAGAAGGHGCRTSRTPRSA